MISQKPTALENCAQMLIEVDSMLDLVKSRSSTQKIKFCPKETSQNFLMAVQILDYRINNSRPTSKNYSASRLKVIPASTLGPGQYFPHSFLKKTPVQSNLTLEYFEKPKKSIKMPLLTSRTPTKSPKEHNLKVERIVKKRLEINLINNIRKRDRFKTKMQTMHEDTKKLYSETLIRLFIPLCLVYRISENIMRKVNEKKVRFK